MHGPKNATYTSPGIQNTLLNIMANLVKDEIFDVVKQAGIYSVLADESNTVARLNNLQLSLTQPHKMSAF